jgi:hypothetical protein
MTRKASKAASRRKSTGLSSDAISRRRFVTMVAAGSAVLLARPGRAQESAGKQAATDAGTGKTGTLSAATQKEFDRQRAGMLATLKTLREAPLPPGGDLTVVFQPRARKAVSPRKTAARKVAR